MSASKKKIYYTYIHNSSFVRVDKRIFEEHFSLVKCFEFNSGSRSVIINFFKSTLDAIINVPKADIVYSFFVGYHTLFPFLLAKLLGKKVVCALGGTECHFFPEINYGNYRKPAYAFFTRRSLELADLILPVDETLIDYHLTYIDAVYPRQGIIPFNNKLHGKIEALNCGFEYTLAESAIIESKRTKNSFITASVDLSGFDYFRKGIDMIIAVAHYLPDASFTLVGDNYDYSTPLPDNVKIVGRLSQQELYNAFLSHEFYLQLSIAEGFPNALAESMLYGCIPIGSNAFGIPGIMNGKGYVLAKKDTLKAIDLLKTAMNSTEKENQSLEAHKSIKTRFSFEKRASRLKTLLNSL
jgi:hypothetical protein